MRHHNANRKFGRERNVRKALLRSLALAVIDKEHIETTEAKAKEIRPYVEKLITKGKTDTLAVRRDIMSRLGSGGKQATKKIVEDLSVRYKERPGGYLRIVKSGRRIGSDGAKMAIIEFVQN